VLHSWGSDSGSLNTRRHQYVSWNLSIKHKESAGSHALHEHMVDCWTLVYCTAFISCNSFAPIIVFGFTHRIYTSLILPLGFHIEWGNTRILVPNMREVHKKILFNNMCSMTCKHLSCWVAT
jgi:hypothetical protein